MTGAPRPSARKAGPRAREKSLRAGRRRGGAATGVGSATRLVCVRCTPHRKRGKGRRRGGGQTGPTSNGVLRIVTDLLDVPAEVVAFLLPLTQAGPGLPPRC